MMRDNAVIFQRMLIPQRPRPSFKRWTYLDIPTLLLALGFIFLSTRKARAGVESMETSRSAYYQHQTGLKVELFL